MPASDSDLLSIPSTRFASEPVRAFIEGRNLDLLAPLEFHRPGTDLELYPRQIDRRALAEEMARANTSYGHPRAEEQAALLADPATVVIVTGQQAGLFGGPLFSLTKMVGAAKWAASLRDQGVPAVAVFWVATEDHDYAEIAHCTLQKGAVQDVLETRRVELQADAQPLMPVGMRTLGSTVESVLAETAEIYQGEHAAVTLRALQSFYRPDARIGEAFARFMVWMLKARAPLLLDSMLPALKEAERPWLKALVERRGEVATVLSAAEARVQASGLKLQVKAQPEASLLFQLCGNRRCRIVWSGDRSYELRGAEESEAAPRSVEELLKTIDENPAVISPGVLARPLVQDAVLGSSLQLMGPGELSYMTQASALYSLFDIDPPATALRPQIMVLGAALTRRLEKLGLTLEEALRHESEVDDWLARRSAPDLVESSRGRILAEIDSLRTDALQIDPQLDRPWQKTRAQIERALEAFSMRLRSAAARLDKTAGQRLDAIRSACLPDGAPQERVLSVAHFALTYGQDFAAAVWEQMDHDSDRIQIIDPAAGRE